MAAASVSIHDPIHGSIEVSYQELKLIDTQPFQRLRNVKQLGFSEMAFPGASHSRYAHSLGAMQMATRMLDRLLPAIPLALGDRAPLLRQAVRLATLFHDLGHPPLSHVSERVMPPVRLLGLPPEALGEGESDRQATHEDYTLLLLMQSELARAIEVQLGSGGLDVAHIAALIGGRHLPLMRGSQGGSTAQLFHAGGVDLLPLLHSIISGELDADRMDYLRRDAYYCGVSYGNFDHVWLCNNLTCVTHEGGLRLGLMHKAVWGFENFLLARYHMFLAVYYHHTTVCFDHLLGRFYAEGGYTLPHAVDAYLGTDDISLITALRASDSAWAGQVVRRQSWRLLLETHAFGAAADDSGLDEALAAAGIETFRTHSQGLLSRYFAGGPAASSLHVWEPERKRARPITAYTPLFARFSERAHISRIYCRPEDFVRARACVPSSEIA